MARLEEWFDEWALSLRDRSGRTDWPDMTTDAGWEFWQDFRRALARCGANWAEADEAASAACDVPGLYVSQYRPMIVEAIKAIQARLQAQDHADPVSSPEAARAASKGCPDCGGEGFAVRYVHGEILGKVRTTGGGIAPVGMAVSYPCSCPMGKLMARGLRQPGQVRDPLTVDEYPPLRLRPVPWSDRPDNKYRHRPAAWDDDRGRPADAPGIATPDDLMVYARSLAQAGGSRARPDRAPQSIRPDLAHAPADPVIDRERARPAPVESLAIPEDDAASGWF